MSLDLLDMAERAAAEALRASPLGGLLRGEIVVDLFCGGGGATQGIEDAGLVVHECVNHCPTAIATHAANHPATNHRRGDVWKNTPEAVAAGRPVGLLWASPDCRHFSRARGAAPVSRRVRDLAWVVTRWAKAVERGEYDARPRVIIVENVPEFLDWGPTRARVSPGGVVMADAQGRVVMEPVPHRKGETFRRWRRLLERAGYRVEWRVLDAADFGAASRRKRLYVIARRDGQPIVWPEVTHGRSKPEGDRSLLSHAHVRKARKGSHGDATGPNDQSSDAPQRGLGGRAGVDYSQRNRSVCGTEVGVQLPHRAAAEVIDWSDLGTSIFERKRPLKDKTLARIAEGIRRYVLNAPGGAPFVLRVTQTGEGRGWKVSGADAPLPTATTRQDLAVCTPVIQANRGNATPRSPGEPLPTITAGNGPGRGAGAGHAISVATPVLMSAGGPECRAVPAGEPLGTVLPRDHRALVTPLLMHNTTHHQGGPVTGPTPTVTTGGQTGLVAPVMAYLNQGAKQSGPVVGEPMRTVVAGGGHAALVAALMVKFYGAEKGGQDARRPLGTVTTLDRHGLVCCVIEGVEFVIVDVLFRMLKPRELAAAMGFPETYTWPATQREAVRLIGNAVSPVQAAALVRAVLPRGMDRGGEEGRAVA